jgi:hypothetical protein
VNSGGESALRSVRWESIFLPVSVDGTWGYCYIVVTLDSHGKMDRSLLEEIWGEGERMSEGVLGTE